MIGTRLRIGLRQRVALTLLLVPGSLLALGIPILFHHQHEQAEERFQQRLVSEAQLLAQVVGQAQATSLDRTIGVDPRLSWRLVASPFEANDPGQALVEEVGTGEGLLHAAGHEFKVVVPLPGRTLPDQALEVRANSATYNRQAIELLSLAAALVVLLGLAGLITAYLTDRGIRGALTSVIEGTQDIVSGNFERRIDIKTGDELQTLAESVNTMAADLSEQRAQLNAHAQDLEHRLAERTLELGKARALAVNQERIAAMGLLAAGLAHEIGNPLTAISTILQGLKRRPEKASGPKLELLLENVSRIQEIVRGMVDYARPPAREWSSISVNDLLRRTLALVQLDPRAKDVVFELALDPDLPRLRSVEGKLQQICLNLLLNSLAAVQALSGPREISVRSQAEGENVCLVIQDNGPGVPPELRARIFEPFVTTRAEEGGSGLGLAVSATLAEELGSRIVLSDSTPQTGARFELCLASGGQGP